MTRLRLVPVPATWKTASIVLLGRSIYQASTYLLSIFVARSSSVAEFGTFSFSLVIAGLAAGGLAGGVVVKTARDVATKSGILRAHAIKAVLGSSLLLALCGLPVVIGLGGTVSTYWACVAFFVSTSLLTLGTSWLAAQGRPNLTAGHEALAGAAAATALIIAYSYSATPAMMATSAAACILFTAVLALRRCESVETAAHGSVLGLLRGSFPFAAMGLVNGGYARVDLLLLGVVSNNAAVGTYAAAQRLMGSVTLIASAFGTLYFPLVASVTSEARPALRAKAQLALLMVFSIPLGVLFVLAPQVLTLVYGEQYEGGVLPLRILAMSILVFGAYWPIAHSLNAAGREWVWLSLLSGGVAVNACFVLILGRYGATGAAAAWLCSEVFLLASVLYSARRLRL